MRKETSHPVGRSDIVQKSNQGNSKDKRLCLAKNRSGRPDCGLKNCNGRIVDGRATIEKAFDEKVGREEEINANGTISPVP